MSLADAGMVKRKGRVIDPAGMYLRQVFGKFRFLLLGLALGLFGAGIFSLVGATFFVLFGIGALFFAISFGALSLLLGRAAIAAVGLGRRNGQKGGRKKNC